MEIYYTENENDFSLLMQKLEERGIVHAPTNVRPTQVSFRDFSLANNCVRVDNKERVFHVAAKEYYETHFPEETIINYRETADEKMRFTKENVEIVVDRHLKETEDSIFVEIVSDIYDMIETTEKVIVPRCFDEWYRGIKAVCTDSDYAKRFALWKICQEGFGHALEDENDNEISHDSELYKWIKKNKMLAIDAILNDYELEKEKLYHVATKEGRILLYRGYEGRISLTEKETSLDKNANNYRDVYQLTEKEIRDYDEGFWYFAKPVNN